jgi:hypothetical protein
MDPPRASSSSSKLSGTFASDAGGLPSDDIELIASPVKLPNGTVVPNRLVKVSTSLHGVLIREPRVCQAVWDVLSDCDRRLWKKGSVMAVVCRTSGIGRFTSAGEKAVGE